MLILRLADLLPILFLSLKSEAIRRVSEGTFIIVKIAAGIILKTIVVRYTAYK